MIREINLKTKEKNWIKTIHSNYHIKSLKSKKKKAIFIPVSKQIKKINKFINHIEKGEFNNLIVINLNELKISKLIDTSREKIYKSYLSLEAQLTLSKIIENIINLLLN